MTNNFDELFEGGPVNDTKTCSKCHQEKPKSAFGRDGGAKYLRHECRACAKKHAAIVTRLKKITPPPSKDHTCPICGSNEEQAKGYNKDKKGVWCLDHDHEREEFRGWICHKCNLGIGNFNNNIPRLRGAADYLERFEKSLQDRI